MDSDGADGIHTATDKFENVHFGNVQNVIFNYIHWFKKMFGCFLGI